MIKIICESDLFNPQENPNLKRIAPNFGWGDDFIKQLDSLPTDSVVNFRNILFVKRKDGLWDMYSKYSNSKLDEPVDSKNVDFYTNQGLHGLYIPQ